MTSTISVEYIPPPGDAPYVSMGPPESQIDFYKGAKVEVDLELDPILVGKLLTNQHFKISDSDREKAQEAVDEYRAENPIATGYPTDVIPPDQIGIKVKDTDLIAKTAKKGRPGRPRKDQAAAAKAQEDARLLAEQSRPTPAGGPVVPSASLDIADESEGQNGPKSSPA